MKKILIIVLGTLCLQHCFNPDLTHIVFACDAEKPECPAGMKCISNRCQVPDADMSQLDQQSTDLSRGPGCVSGGMQVGSAWACQGPFDSMTKRAASLCNVGFSICKDALLVDQIACNKLQEFYAAQVLADTSTAPIQCRFSGMTNTRGWGGCGTHLGAVFASANKCGGFDKAVDCASIAWTCPTDQLNDAIVRTIQKDGVLCCPM